MTLNTIKVLAGPAILGAIVLFKKNKNLKQTYTITKKPIYRNTVNSTNNNNLKKPINQSFLHQEYYKRNLCL